MPVHCLAGMLAGRLAPRTMRRIKASIPAVTEKFAAYRTEQLADLWAKTLLDDAGVDVPETTEPL